MLNFVTDDKEKNTDMVMIPQWYIDGYEDELLDSEIELWKLNMYLKGISVSMKGRHVASIAIEDLRKNLVETIKRIHLVGVAVRKKHRFRGALTIRQAHY